MNAPTFIALYNQTIQSDEDFLAGFVARGDVADFLLDQLRRTEPEAPAQAQLLIGGRGMGKTSLLRRLAIGVAADETLRARYVPLRFREEQYNVLTLADFWRNCAESLAEWCETNHPESDFPALFDRLAASVEWRDPETVFAAFWAEALALRLRPLLLIDNLDIVISNVSAQENWALRRTLQLSDGPVLVAAATHVPEQTADRDAAFYEFFRLHLLQPLNADDLIRCVRKLAQRRGEAGAPVAEIVEKEPQRLRALHVFTGGNPRVLALIYRLLETNSTHEALADLEALLDQLTPYYKGRVEEYQTKLQRAVIDALALNWDPISAHDLSAATAVEVTTVSSQLTRLRNDGLIEEVELAGARAGYQMIERLFNIWYLMRHGTRRTRNRVVWLTKFLVLFYPSEELRRMSAGFVLAGERIWEIEYYREALAEAMQALGWQDTPLDLSDGDEETDAEERAMWDEVLSAYKSKRFEDALAGARRLRAVSEATMRAATPLWMAAASFAESDALLILGRDEEELAAFNEGLTQLGQASEPPAHCLVAQLLVHKGDRLGALGRAEEAIAAYDEAIARFDAAVDQSVSILVTKTPVHKGDCLGELGPAKEAVAAYKKTFASFGETTEQSVSILVAKALVQKGFHLGTLGRAEEAISAYDDAIARFGEATDQDVSILVAKALGQKGLRLHTLGRAQEEIAAYDECLMRFRERSDPEMRAMTVAAQFIKGVRLSAIGRVEEAIAVYDEGLARSSEATDARLRTIVTLVLFLRGFHLCALGRAQEEIAAYDQALTRYDQASEPVLRGLAASALFRKGIRLSGLGQMEQALAAYDEVLSRFSEASEPAVRERVADALINKGFVLAENFGRFAEAAAAARQALEIAPAQSPFVKFNLAWAELALGKAAAVASLRPSLSDAPKVRMALLDAGCELAADNFGAAIVKFEYAFSHPVSEGVPDDLIRLLRIGYTRGYGEKLIEYFETAGPAVRLAPVYIALVAMVRGERQLLNVNPETRGPAEAIYRRLVAPLRAAAPLAPQKPAGRRGRPPKRRGR